MRLYWFSGLSAIERDLQQLKQPPKVTKGHWTPLGWMESCTVVNIKMHRIISCMGAINSDGIEILDDLGWNITQVTDDNREKAVSLPVPTTVGNDPVLQRGRHY